MKRFLRYRSSLRDTDREERETARRQSDFESAGPLLLSRLTLRLSHMFVLPAVPPHPHSPAVADCCSCVSHISVAPHAHRSWACTACCPSLTTGEGGAGEEHEGTRSEEQQQTQLHSEGNSSDEELQPRRDPLFIVVHATTLTISPLLPPVPSARCALLAALCRCCLLSLCVVLPRRWTRLCTGGGRGAFRCAALLCAVLCARRVVCSCSPLRCSLVRCRPCPAVLSSLLRAPTTTLRPTRGRLVRRGALRIN